MLWSDCRSDYPFTTGIVYRRLCCRHSYVGYLFVRTLRVCSASRHQPLLLTRLSPSLRCVTCPTASTKISPLFCMSELQLAGLVEKDFYCRRFSFQSERVKPTTWRNKRVCLPKLMSLRGHRIASSKPDSQGSVCPSNTRHVRSLHMTYCGAKEGTEPQCMSEIFSFCCNGFFVSMLQPCN